jgi:hypothetical protein
MLLYMLIFTINSEYWQDKTNVYIDSINFTLENVYSHNVIVNLFKLKYCVYERIFYKNKLKYVRKILILVLHNITTVKTIVSI